MLSGLGSEVALCRTSLLAWLSRGFILLLLLCGLAACQTRQATSVEEKTATTSEALLTVRSEPSGANVYYDDEFLGTTPIQGRPVAAGEHVLTIVKEGFADIRQTVSGESGQLLEIDENLADIAAPELMLGDAKANVAPEEGLKISVDAQDNVGVAQLTALVDGQTVSSVEEAHLRINVDTRDLMSGTHSLTFVAEDAAGNMAEQSLTFTITAPIVGPTPTSTSRPTAMPTRTTSATAIATAIATPTTTPPPTPTPKPKAVAFWDQITIDTYQYEEALYEDPEGAGHPYPLLDADQVGAPVQQVYDVIRLRNEYLELTFLPDLGGRLYQCRFLPTNQDILYNNSVIKPTTWGPPDQGWWLAVGGIEYCLPVDEHGYVTAEPWEAEIVEGEEGEISVIMRIIEESRSIEVQVTITLFPGETGFSIDSQLHNLEDDSKQFQYWINAMLSPGEHEIGPSLRFWYPTSHVIVHSRGEETLPEEGQEMTWPIYDDRDFSLYANWSDWLGFFAPQIASPYSAVYDEAQEIGIARLFPREEAPGVKLFGFGPDFGDAGLYTDDGSQYVEMWGGLTPTFWDEAQLGPYEQVGWQESWYVLSDMPGISAINDHLVAFGERHEKGAVLYLQTWRSREWRVSLQGDGQELVSQTITTQAGQSTDLFMNPSGWNEAESLVVNIANAAGETVLSFGL